MLRYRRILRFCNNPSTYRHRIVSFNCSARRCLGTGPDRRNRFAECVRYHFRQHAPPSSLADFMFLSRLFKNWLQPHRNFGQRLGFEESKEILVSKKSSKSSTEDLDASSSDSCSFGQRSRVPRSQGFMLCRFWGSTSIPLVHASDPRMETRAKDLMKAPRSSDLYRSRTGSLSLLRADHTPRS